MSPTDAGPVGAMGRRDEAVCICLFPLFLPYEFSAEPQEKMDMSAAGRGRVVWTKLSPASQHAMKDQKSAPLHVKVDCSKASRDHKQT